MHSWNRLLSIDGGYSEPSTIFNAARADLVAISRAIGREFRVALPFAVGSADFSTDVPHLSIDVGEVRVEITAPVLDIVRDRSVAPLDLLASALSAQSLDETWRPRRIGLATGLDDDRLEANRRIFRRTMAAESVERALEKGRDVLVVGPHGSGRTALASVLADNFSQQTSPTRGVVWLDLSDPADGPETIFATLLQAEHRESYLLVLEGLEANLPVVNSLFQCVARLRADFGLKVQVLATGWPSVADLVLRDGMFELAVYRVDPRQTIDLMLEESVPRKDWPALLRLSSNDVHLAAEVIGLHRPDMVPTELDLQERLVDGVETAAERKALYTLACLGIFDLALPPEDARRLGPGVVAGLHQKQIVHRTDGAYTVAQGRARLVLKYARSHWAADIGGLGKPESIVWQHLQKGGERLIRATLSRIDEVVSPENLRPASLSVLAAWEKSEQLAAWLEKRTRQDPTWGDNLGAAVFAAIALTRLKRDELWLSIVEPIRQRWNYSDPSQRELIYQGQSTADYADFEAIAEQMGLADTTAYGRPDGHPSGISSRNFRREATYLNWALGLLLCLEGTAPPQFQDQPRIRQLLALAQWSAEPAGNFYPTRIPWVTARILLGLCHADHAPKLNPTVRNAARWLIYQIERDDAEASWWRAGTGTWNRDEATTAMCITALTEVGYQDRESIQLALAWLVDRKDTWLRADHEIDLAQVIEAFVRNSVPFDEYLRELLGRTINELDAEPKPLPEERLRRPFLAAQLAEIVWYTVHREFFRLLQDVLEPESDENGEAEAGPPTASTPAAPPKPEHEQDEPCGLSSQELRRWQEACAQLRQALNSQISQRMRPQLAAVARVQAELTIRVRQRDDCIHLSDQLNARSPQSVLSEIDRLGQEVLGPAWFALPYPRRYCDDDLP